MKLSIPLLALTIAAFSSCTSAYKTGQTPDDVYFSPVRDQDEYVRVEKRDDRQYRGSDDYYEDRFLRMRLQDRYRWSALDDYYFYNSYAYNPYGNYYSLNSPWNTHWAWNAYYNPYCGGIPYYPGTIIIKNPRTYTPPSRAIAFNPKSYGIGSSSSSVGNRGLNNSYNAGGYNNSNRNNNSSLGQSLRKVFSGGNSNSNNSYNSNNSSTPSRSYNPSSSSSSSSGNRGGGSSGGSSGGGVSRPPR
jgi:hypothetical protein